ncbi:MAG: sugar phosphate nucleotidyltransferase [Candidatus Aenigmatarchaeota archaeon]
MKARISLTVDSALIKRADKLIDNINFGSRSEFIETCIKKFLSESETAVVLGGGDPERLKLNGQFKFLIPIHGEKTLLDLLFEKLSSFGKIYVVAQREVIDACFGHIGDRIGTAEIIYIEEKTVLGNAKTLELVKDKLNQEFLILPIDQYYDVDFSDLIRKHEINSRLFKGVITLVATPNGDEKKLGNVAMLGSQIVQHIEGNAQSRKLASAFAAVCDKRVFTYIPKGVVKWCLQDDVYPKIIKDGGMFGYISEQPLFNIHAEKDINQLKRYLREKYSANN